MSDLTSALVHQVQSIKNQFSFSITDQQVEKLVGFVILLNKWNKAYNLSSVRDPEQMLVKHIFDSIVVTPFLKGSTVIDVGTGPGLPGIPLAIMCEHKQFTLVDSLGKRIRFIKQAVHELKIHNVTAIQSRVEDIKDLKSDIVISRAFASMSDMLYWCEHLVSNEGAFFALKGQLHKEELDQVPSQFKIKDTVLLSVPLLSGERHLVTIVKQPIL